MNSIDLYTPASSLYDRIKGEFAGEPNYVTFDPAQGTGPFGQNQSIDVTIADGHSVWISSKSYWRYDLSLTGGVC